MIIAYYSNIGTIDTRFLRLYEGQTLEALYLDGHRAAVIIENGKAYLV